MRAQGYEWARCARCGYATYTCYNRGCETREERQERLAVEHADGQHPTSDTRGCPECRAERTTK